MYARQRYKNESKHSFYDTLNLKCPLNKRFPTSDMITYPPSFVTVRQVATGNTSSWKLYCWLYSGYIHLQRADKPDRRLSRWTSLVTCFRVASDLGIKPCTLWPRWVTAQSSCSGQTARFVCVSANFDVLQLDWIRAYIENPDQVDWEYDIELCQQAALFNPWKEGMTWRRLLQRCTEQVSGAFALVEKPKSLSDHLSTLMVQRKRELAKELKG